MKKLVIAAGVVFFLLVATAVFLGGMIGGVIKTGVETVAPKATGSAVTLANVDVSLFSGGVSLNGFLVGNPEGFKTDSAVKFNDFKVKLDLGSLQSDTILIEQIVIDGAEVTWEGSLKGSNIARIQSNVDSFIALLASGKPAAEEKPDAAASETKVIIREFIFRNASVRLSMTLAQGKAITIPIPEIRLTDIGKEGEPKTMGETLNEIMPKVFGGVREAVLNNQEMLKDAGETLKEAGGTLKEATGSLKEAGTAVGDKLKGLLNR